MTAAAATIATASATASLPRSSMKRLMHAVTFAVNERADGTVQWGLPLVFVGGPGRAKSALIEAFGIETGLPTVILSPGELQEGAFGVVPVPVTRADGSIRLVYPAPDWVDVLDKGGLLFIDELSCANLGLQAPLLGLIHRRVIGMHYLGNRVRVLAAMNPAKQAVGGTDLAMPTANRMGHLPWPDGTPSSWGEYILRRGSGQAVTAKIDPLVEEQRVLAAWPGAYQSAAPIWVAFMHARPELLNKEPENYDPEASKAWPSERSNDFACLAYTSSLVHGLNRQEQEALVAAFIGDGPANEFFAYEEKADIPSAEDVLDGKVKFKHDPRRLDITAAVVQGCTLLVVRPNTQDRIPRATNLWKLLGQIAPQAVDLAIPAAYALVDADLRVGCGKVAEEVMNQLAPATRALRGSKGQW